MEILTSVGRNGLSSFVDANCMLNFHILRPFVRIWKSKTIKCIWTVERYIIKL